MVVVDPDALVVVVDPDVLVVVVDDPVEPEAGGNECAAKTIPQTSCQDFHVRVSLIPSSPGAGMASPGGPNRFGGPSSGLQPGSSGDMP